jgi:hypothetical protein
VLHASKDVLWMGAPTLFSRAWDDDLKAKPGIRWRTFRSAEDKQKKIRRTGTIER